MNVANVVPSASQHLVLECLHGHTFKIVTCYRMTTQKEDEIGLALQCGLTNPLPRVIFFIY